MPRPMSIYVILFGMIGFLIRKTIYDLWDNMFRIVVLNLGFLAVTAVPAFVPSLVSKFNDSMALEMAIYALGVFVCSIYLSAAALCVKQVSDYGVFGFRDFFSNLKPALPAGLAMGGFIILLYMVATVIIPFYLAIDSFFGVLLAAFIFWLAIFALLSFQYYFTVYGRLSKNLYKAFKKCMLISLDNSGFSFFLMLHNIVVMILSTVFVFMFPGPVGVLLYLDQALRLRLLKYDYLEQNPTANRKKIPWDVLLIDDREKTGTRTLRNFIFPWKD